MRLLFGDLLLLLLLLGLPDSRRDSIFRVGDDGFFRVIEKHTLATFFDSVQTARYARDFESWSGFLFKDYEMIYTQSYLQ